MNQEIERKFKLLQYPQEQIDSGELKFISRKTIEQTYLALTDQEEFRVRKLTDHGSGETSYTHTFKRGKGLSREEIELEISADIYAQLLGGSGRRPLVKTRTKVAWKEYRFEIDEYHQYELMTIEVEFPNASDALRFQAPAWFGPEVGSAEEYRNKELWASLQSAASS